MVRSSQTKNNCSCNIHASSIDFHTDAFHFEGFDDNWNVRKVL